MKLTNIPHSIALFALLLTGCGGDSTGGTKKQKSDDDISDGDNAAASFLGCGDGQAGDEFCYFARYDLALRTSSSSVMNIRSAHAVDLNGDNLDDLAVVANAIPTGSALMVNDGKGSFRISESLCDSISNDAMVRWFDYDADGRTDLLTVANGTLYWAPNSAWGKNCQLKTLGTVGEISEFDVCDVNGDLRPDIVGFGADVVVARQNEAGLVNVSHLSVADDLNSIVCGDENGDSKNDLIVAGNDANSAALWVLNGSGDGSFLAPERRAIPTWQGKLNLFAMVDIDGDGFRDVVGRGSTQGNFGPLNSSFFISWGNAAFGEQYEAITVPVYARETNHIDVRDIDGDGRRDLVMLSARSTVGSACLSGTYYFPYLSIGFLESSRQLSWSEPLQVRVTPIGVVSGRFDNDEIADLAVVQDPKCIDQKVVGDRPTLALLPGRSSRSFGPIFGDAMGVNAAVGSRATLGSAQATIDLNGDGIADQVSVMGAEITVALNQAGGQEAIVRHLTNTKAFERLVVGRYNNDALADIVLSKEIPVLGATSDVIQTEIEVRLGDANFEFASAPVAAPTLPGSVYMADVDRNGTLDFLSYDKQYDPSLKEYVWWINVWRNEGSGPGNVEKVTINEEPCAQGPTIAETVGKDAWPELLVPRCGKGQGLKLYRGSASSFRYFSDLVLGEKFFDVFASDANGDGLDDIYVRNDSPDFQLLEGFDAKLLLSRPL